MALRNVPAISVEDMRSIDRNIDKFGIDVLQLMENAGRSVAILARRLLKGSKKRKICILAGKGNNGGDAISAGRFLHGWGASVSVIIPERYGNLHSLTRKQADSARKAGIGVYYPADARKFSGSIKNASLIIDGLLGYNIKGNPKGKYAGLIKLANASKKTVLAVDGPSGLNMDSGESYDPCIRATATLALGLPKRGLLETGAKKHIGELYIGDIGIPHAAYKKAGIKPPVLFSRSSVIKASAIFNDKKAN